MNDNHEASRLKNEEAAGGEIIAIHKDCLEELEIKLDMYRRATAWLVRELGGGEVYVPALAFEESGTVMFRVNEQGVTFRTFTEVPSTGRVN